MAERRDLAGLDDDALGALLADLGERIVTSTAVRGGTPPARRPRQGRHRLAALVAVAAAVAVLVLAVPASREAVADWLGLGTTDVVRLPAGAPSGEGLAHLATALAAVTEAEARAELGRDLPDTAGTPLGAPQHLGVPPEGGVLLAWADGATTLWVHEETVGAGALYRKLLDVEDEVRSVEGVGDSALLVVGGHVLDTPARRLAAANVLLWTADGLEHRLESDLPPDTLVAIARAL